MLVVLTWTAVLIVGVLGVTSSVGLVSLILG
jgi:hypothetical protein